MDEIFILKNGIQADKLLKLEEVQQKFANYYYDSEGITNDLYKK